MRLNKEEIFYTKKKENIRLPSSTMSLPKPGLSSQSYQSGDRILQGPAEGMNPRKHLNLLTRSQMLSTCSASVGCDEGQRSENKILFDDEFKC